MPGAAPRGAAPAAMQAVDNGLGDPGRTPVEPGKKDDVHMVPNGIDAASAEVAADCNHGKVSKSAVKKIAVNMSKTLKSLRATNKRVQSISHDLDLLGRHRQSHGCKPFKTSLDVPGLDDAAFGSEGHSYTIQIPPNSTFRQAMDIVHRNHLLITRSLEQSLNEERKKNFENASNFESYVAECIPAAQQADNTVFTSGVDLGFTPPPGLFEDGHLVDEAITKGGP